ncbi:hypothetical protein MMC32_004285 [Xylographa parallela]|nr:hypothetical protein [Xylographa parallela]
MAPWFRQGLIENQHNFQGHNARASVMAELAQKFGYRTASTYSGNHGDFINMGRMYWYDDGYGNLEFATRRSKLLSGDLVAVPNAAGHAIDPRGGSGKSYGGSYYGEGSHGHGRGPTHGRPSRGHHGGQADGMNEAHRPGPLGIKEHVGGRPSRGHYGDQAGSKSGGGHRGPLSMGEAGEGRKAHQGQMWTSGPRGSRARGNGRTGLPEQRSDRSDCKNLLLLQFNNYKYTSKATALLTRQNTKNIISHLSSLQSTSQKYTTYLHDRPEFFLTTHIHLTTISRSSTHLQPSPLQPQPPTPPSCAGATSASTRRTSTQTAPPCALLTPTSTAPTQAPITEDGSDCLQECTLEPQATAVEEAMVVLGLEDLSGAGEEVTMEVGRGACTGQVIQGFLACDEGEEEGGCLVEEAERPGWVDEVWEGMGHRGRVVVEEMRRLGIGPGGAIGELSGDVGVGGIW